MWVPCGLQKVARRLFLVGEHGVHLSSLLAVAVNHLTLESRSIRVYNVSGSCGGDVASSTIRNFDEPLKARLRVQAATHGRSMEDEARDILRSALSREPSSAINLAAAIRARFAPLGGAELPSFPREPMRAAPSFEE
jgi:plasmid stability protein